MLGVPEPLLSTADWFASLPSVYLSASMLITDSDDRILLVKPNYRPDWGIPGGIVEADEAPDQCVTREIAEELALAIPAGDLLVVDWMGAAGDRPLVTLLEDTGRQKGATAAQVALAWLLTQKPWIVPIPGTTKLERLKENIGAAALELTADDLRDIESATSKITVQGARYPEKLEKLIDR